MAKLKAPGKWAEGLTGDTPAADAAAVVMDARLAGVEDLLPGARDKADKEIEYVHQLRVATRRSDAALRIFDRFVPAKQYRRARRRLRRIRRAAGAARECDVHLAILREHRPAAGDERAAYGFLLKRTRAERRAAQELVAAAARRHPVPKLRRHREKLLRSLRVRDDDRVEGRAPTLCELAADELPEIVDEVRAAADRDMSVLENLHGLRIAGKKLRYALEVFSPCLGPGFRETVYPDYAAFQDRLGDINDLHEISRRIGRLRADAPADAGFAAALEAVEVAWRRRLASCVERFLADWRSGTWAHLLDGLPARFRGDNGGLGATHPVAGALDAPSEPAA
ncbi:MAG: CHAD domain-containing protein [Planctomycetota bacterium]|jgi:CHAD domain-containing protein